MRPKKRMADLFCGAGGTSTGAMLAFEELGFDVELTAINHWNRAIETHYANHPNSRHLCTAIDNVDPYNLYRPGQLHLLWASPECTEHSYAKGGRPVNDQRRVTAWCVVRWAEALLPPVILVENVPQFLKWGPVDSRGKPIKHRRGEIFRAWVSALEALGYTVEPKILCAADFGDPTSRERLFVQAVRGRRRIHWPAPTHGTRLRPWRGAREIIDWSLRGRWLDEMPGKRQYGGLPLAPNTLRRIFKGFETEGLKGSNLKPFVVAIDHTGGNGRCVWPEDAPLSTITTKARHCVIEPFLVELRGTSDRHLDRSARSLDTPLNTLTAGGGHNALIEPFLVQCTHGNGEMGDRGNARRVKSINAPLPTVCGRGDMALVEPFIVPQQSGGRARNVSEPLPAVTTTATGIALVQPYLVKFYGTGGAASIDQPLDTITSKDRFALLCPEVKVDGQKGSRVRFRFRMLQDHELALAHGFPPTYRFTGTKSEKVVQIGNSVPVGLSRALVRAVLLQGGARG